MADKVFFYYIYKKLAQFYNRKKHFGGDVALVQGEWRWRSEYAEEAGRDYKTHIFGMWLQLMNVCSCVRVCVCGRLYLFGAWWYKDRSPTRIYGSIWWFSNVKMARLWLGFALLIYRKILIMVLFDFEIIFNSTVVFGKQINFYS